MDFVPSVSQKPSRKRKASIFWLLALLLLIIAGGSAAWLRRHHNSTPVVVSTSPVPKDVSQAVNFPVYYPDPARLPAGYILNPGSFKNPVKNGVSYSVSYDSGKKLVFSVQAKPSDNELQTFNSNYIPLRIDYQTAIGQAELGAYHNQTLVSLPIMNGPWIVITAPPDISQDDLKTILSALKH